MGMSAGKGSRNELGHAGKSLHTIWAVAESLVFRQKGWSGTTSRQARDAASFVAVCRRIRCGLGSCDCAL